MDFKTRYYALQLLRDLLIIGSAIHQRNPYPYLAGAISLLLGFTPLMAEQLPRPWRITCWSLSGLSALTAASQLEKRAQQRDRLHQLESEAEDDRQFQRHMQRGLLEEIMTIRVDAEMRRAELENYQNLPLWIHPYGRQISQYDQSDPVQGFLDGMLAGLDKALADPIAVTALPADGAPAPSQATSPFPEFDLAGEAAKSDKSLLLSAQSGVGKTTFLKHFLHAANREYNGCAMFDVLDFKGTTGHYCGLEQTQYYTKSGAAGANYHEAIALISRVVGMLDNRAIATPYYFLVDEINNGLEQAKAWREYDEHGKVISTPQKPEDALKSSLKFVVTQGRERLIRGVFTAHGNLMTLMGIDGDTAQSLVCAILGRKLEQGNGFALIEKMLSQHNVWMNRDDRNRLAVQLKQAQQIVDADGRAIALTNLRGAWELVILPAWYANDPGPIQWDAPNQTITQLMRSTPAAPPSPPPLSTLSPIQHQVLRLLAQAGNGVSPDQVFRSVRGMKEWEWNQTIADLARLGWLQLVGAHQVLVLAQVPEPGALSPPAQAILDKYIQKELSGQSVNASWVKNFAFRSRELSQFSADEIRGLFEELATNGQGVITGEGSQMEWGMPAA